MPDQHEQIALRLRSARFEGGAALVLGSAFGNPKRTLEWAHVGIAQLLKERMVHRIWTRTRDPQLARVAAFLDLLPEIVDGNQGAPEYPGLAIVSVQGCHRDRYPELVAQEAVDLWLAVGLSAEDEALSETLSRLPADQVWLVPGQNADQFFETLAKQFGDFPPVFAYSQSDALRGAALAQLLKKLPKDKRVVAFEEAMLSKASEALAEGRRLLQRALLEPPSEVEVLSEEANRKLEIAHRIKPSAEGLTSWGESLMLAARSLHGLRAARLYRQAAHKLHEASRLDPARPVFEAWRDAVGLIAKHTPAEAAVALHDEVDREYQWRIAHGVPLTTEDFLAWGEVLVTWAGLAPREEEAKLMALARLRFDEARRRGHEEDDVTVAWAQALWRRATTGGPLEAERLLGDALEAIGMRALPHARLIAGRCYFALAALRSGDPAELLRRADEAFEQAGASPGEWAQAYARVAEIRGRLDRASAPPLFARAYELFARAGDDRGWGAALLVEARVMGSPRERLEAAREKSLEAESREDGCASFDLARLAAILRDEAGCRGWLEKAARTGRLPSFSQLTSASELAPYRDKEWFRSLAGAV